VTVPQNGISIEVPKVEISLPVQPAFVQQSVVQPVINDQPMVLQQSAPVQPVSAPVVLQQTPSIEILKVVDPLPVQPASVQQEAIAIMPSQAVQTPSNVNVVQQSVAQPFINDQPIVPQQSPSVQAAFAPVALQQVPLVETPKVADPLVVQEPLSAQMQAVPIRDSVAPSQQSLRVETLGTEFPASIHQPFEQRETVERHQASPYASGGGTQSVTDHYQANPSQQFVSSEPLKPPVTFSPPMPQPQPEYFDNPKPVPRDEKGDPSINKLFKSKCEGCSGGKGCCVVDNAALKETAQKSTVGIFPS
jgi:hypothetical protein